MLMDDASLALVVGSRRAVGVVGCGLGPGVGYWLCHRCCAWMAWCWHSIDVNEALPTTELILEFAWQVT